MLRLTVKGRKGGQRGHGKAGGGRKCEGWFGNERCTLPLNVECQRKQDCCWVEVNLVILTCWQYYQIVTIGVSLSYDLAYFRPQI